MTSAILTGPEAATKADRPVRAAIYVRISKDKVGAGLGVDRQEKDCRELAERLGWQVAEVFVDNDLSAYSGKPARTTTGPVRDR